MTKTVTTPSITATPEASTSPTIIACKASERRVAACSSTKARASSGIGGGHSFDTLTHALANFFAVSLFMPGVYAEAYTENLGF
jgi:hypothetical protein